MIRLKLQFEPFCDAYYSSDSASFHARPRPLVLPLLAHRPYQRAVERWVADIISNSKDDMVPFHLPHKKCVAGKHRSLRDVIYNNISMAESWSWESPPSCNCSQLRQRHPFAKFVDGHLASPLSLMSFSGRLQHIPTVLDGFSTVPQLASLHLSYMACR